MKVLVNPKNKLFRWGPIDGRPFLPDFWHFGLVNSTKKYKPGWPAAFNYFHDEKVLFVCDYKKLYNNGEKIFRKYILPDKQFQKRYAIWESVIKKLENEIHKISSLNFKKVSDRQLEKHFFEWLNICGIEFWDIGLLPEIANWGGEQLLKRKLEKSLKKEKDLHLAMESLSAPEEFSFYQVEELDLLALKNIEEDMELERALSRHQQKYFWILNSYHHTQVLPIDYFRKALKSFSRSAAQKKVKEFNDFKKRAVHHKHKVVERLNLPSELLTLGQRLSFCIWWQDSRKAYIFRANHVHSLFLHELSRRFAISFQDLHFYTVNEIKKLLKGKAMDTEEMKRRKKHFIAVFDPLKSVHYASGDKALNIIELFISQDIDNNIREFKGLVVNQGKAKGQVKLIQGVKDFPKMKKGDILVSSMTAPDYIPALKKATAIITDEGGMTCHAAIVSRELKIPGIVGTRIATKVLRDGDLVEVDANKGIVKILK